MPLTRRGRGRDPGPPERPDPFLTALDPAARAVVEAAHPYSMTGVPRLAGLVEAVRHLVRTGVEGAFAECGVWRGGSVLAMVLTLRDLGVDDRDVHLYDTFEGMTSAEAVDTSPFHGSAVEIEQAAAARGERAFEPLFDPSIFSEQAVRDLVLGTGYPAARVHVHRGRVEDTLPAAAPASLALVRLDTDWYASTRHELEVLWPRLAPGGVLVIDDYGHWDGCRRAVDEFMATLERPPLLVPLDYSARLAVKLCQAAVGTRSASRTT